MTQKDAYLVAVAMADVLSAKKSSFSYATVKLDTVRQFFSVPRFPDSFISQDSDSACLSDLLSKGYRWVRSDGDMAVFELETRH